LFVPHAAGACPYFLPIRIIGTGTILTGDLIIKI
jgi:hypothetical protein